MGRQPLLFAHSAGSAMVAKFIEVYSAKPIQDPPITLRIAMKKAWLRTFSQVAFASRGGLN
jgi:hypothetical protein